MIVILKMQILKLMKKSISMKEQYFKKFKVSKMSKSNKRKLSVKGNLSIYNIIFLQIQGRIEDQVFHLQDRT